MENAKMEQCSGGSSGSVGDGMSIFGESIDVWRPGIGKSRRRAIQKNLSSDIEQAARSGMDRLHRRPAIAEGRARAESELSRATTMAKKLERQVEQTDVKAKSHKSELQGTRESSSSSRRKKGLLDVNVEARGAGSTRQQESSTTYVEVMQELDRVKRELRELQHEVKVAREAKAKAERDAETLSAAPMTMNFGSLVADGVKRGDADDDANEAHVVVELSGAGRSATETEEATGRSRTEGLKRDTTTSRASESSDLEAWLTAASSDEGLRRHGTNDDSSEATAITMARHEEHDSSSSLRVAEAELDSAQTELGSIRGEDLRFTASMERTRKQTARVAEEISRLEEQEKKAMAQVQQLSGKLLEARSRLDAVTAANEKAGEILSDLRMTLQQLDEEMEAAEKEKALTELETRCAIADAESVDAEIAAAEQRIRESATELEAARASEAAATEKLRAAVVKSATLAREAVASRRSGNVTIPRFEYEYLTGRAEVVRAVADKKVAAAEAWVEARRAGEKELTMRAEAIERELGDAEAVAEVVSDQNAVEQQTPRDGLQRAHRPKRPNGASAAPSRRKTTTTVSSSPSSPVVRKTRPPSRSIKNNRMILIPNYLKLIGGKCTGRN